MNIRKPLLIAGVVSSVAFATVGGAHAVSAATTPNDESLAQKIALKFNLQEKDVKSFIDENRTARREQHREEHKTKINGRLDQAVKDGKITAQQKDLIIAKLAEVHKAHEADHEAMKDKTPEEQRNFREAKRTEIENWANKNNIPTEYILMGGKGKMGGGHSRHGNHNEVSMSAQNQ
jgi:hypothetical protein